MSNITEVFLNILYLILSTAVVTGMGLLTSYFKKKIATAKDKSESEAVDSVLDAADLVITNTIDALTQTIVSGLKKQNLFTEEKQKEVFNTAKEQIMNSLTDSMKAAILTKFGMEASEYLNTKIESVIANNKK